MEAGRTCACVCDGRQHAVVHPATVKVRAVLSAAAWKAREEWVRAQQQLPAQRRCVVVEAGANDGEGVVECCEGLVSAMRTRGAARDVLVAARRAGRVFTARGDAFVRLQDTC